MTTLTADLIAAVCGQSLYCQCSGWRLLTVSPLLRITDYISNQPRLGRGGQLAHNWPTALRLMTWHVLFEICTTKFIMLHSFLQLIWNNKKVSKYQCVTVTYSMFSLFRVIVWWDLYKETPIVQCSLLFFEVTFPSGHGSLLWMYCISLIWLFFNSNCQKLPINNGKMPHHPHQMHKYVQNTEAEHSG